MHEGPSQTWALGRAQCPQDHQRSFRLSSPGPATFTSAKKPPRLLPTLPRPHTVGGSSVAPRYKASHLAPEPWTQALATRLLQGTQWTQEPRMAADPGTGTQRAVGTVRRQAALPCRGDGLPLPTGLRHGQPGRGRPTLLIFQQEDKWKYRVLVNLLRVWTLV